VPSSALYDIVDAIISKLGSTYSAMVEKKADIIAALQKEENAFGKNLRQ
jgi:alanyl-tRNA synthetase